jgi:CDP-glucose 4,6-dehydratase
MNSNINVVMYRKRYYRKRVLVTGNTGFKGTWLTSWLLSLGAEVIGLSKDVPTSPAMFDELKLAKHIRHYEIDIRDLVAVTKIMERERPDFIFHLAAQSIVSVSYLDPVETFTSNTVGTMNILEALRHVNWPCVAVLITSDKCYDNVEWVWGYKETDNLGGKDIYSSSKGAAELVIKSYVKSFFQSNNHPVRIGIGRAGNVIGGGDWAKDRIVVDCMTAWSKDELVEIRSPQATRPWQHVLEPLSGYLALGAELAGNSELHGEAFNFGPRAEQNRRVVELLGDLSEHWGFDDVEQAYRVTGNLLFNEAGLLKLNCDKALFYLKWEPTLDYQETIQFVGQWYYTFYRKHLDMYDFTLEQILQYEKLAETRGRVWRH